MDSRVSASDLPLKPSDFLTRAQLRRNPFYNELLRPRGIEFQMKIWLPTPQDVVRGFFFERDSGRRGLEERDRAVLALLRPHLASIRERWERRHRPPLLTAREIHVLELVAEGLTQRRSRRQACDLTYHRPRAARERVRQTRRPHAHSCGRVAQRRTKNLIAPDGERARHAIPSFRLALVGPLGDPAWAVPKSAPAPSSAFGARLLRAGARQSGAVSSGLERKFGRRRQIVGRRAIENECRQSL